MRKINYFLAMLALTVAVAAGVRAEEFSVTAMSYNIQIGLNADRSGRDLNETARVIAAANADVTGMQEVDVNAERSGMVDQAAFIADLVGQNFFFGHASDRSPGQYGNVALSRYKLELIEVLPVPASEEESRSAIIVKVHAPTPFYFVVTHLAYQRDLAIEKSRTAALELITKRIEEAGYIPAILAGDLNCTLNSPPVKQLRELGWLIANDLKPDALSYPAGAPKTLLDYIAAYPAYMAEAIDFSVIKETSTSDHRPVIATIKFDTSINKPIPPEDMPKENPIILIKTSMGDITCELFANEAPTTVAAYVEYINAAAFNGTIFHRVIPDFMIQGGGFKPDMKQPISRTGIPNEAANGISNDRGTLALARTNDPHSGTTQFFINLVDNHFLNFKSADREGYGYCVFGKVIAGMEVVDAIAKVPTGRRSGHENVPVTPVVIESVTFVKTSE